MIQDRDPGDENDFDAKNPPRTSNKGHYSLPPEGFLRPDRQRPGYLRVVPPCVGHALVELPCDVG